MQLWLTAANSPQSHSFGSALSVLAHGNMKALETCVYLLLTGLLPPPLPIMALCNHSCVCIAEPSGPSITGGKDCSGNWQPCCHLATKKKKKKTMKKKNISIEPKWPVALWWFDFILFIYFFHLSAGNSVYPAVIE